MKLKFILCENADAHLVTHIICTTHVAIFDYPAFNLISGCNDPKVRESAIAWFENRDSPVIMKTRSIPIGYRESLLAASRNIESIGLAKLSKDIGISERSLTFYIENLQAGKKSSSMPMSFRKKFIDEIEKLEFKE